MNLRTTASVLFATVATSLVAPAAFAGTTTNTWTNGTSTGTQKVRVNNVRVEAGDFHRETQNLKIDAVTEPGGFAQSNINFNGGSFTGGGVANINNGVDPYVNAGYSKNIETGSFSDITTTKVNQNSTSFDRIRSHSLDTSF